MVNAITSPKVVGKFPSLFAPGLGCYGNVKFSLAGDSSIQPKYCKSRPVPYALKPKVDVALD